MKQEFFSLKFLALLVTLSQLDKYNTVVNFPSLEQQAASVHTHLSYKGESAASKKEQMVRQTFHKTRVV